VVHSPLAQSQLLRTTRSTQRVRIALGAEVPIEFTERSEDDPQVPRPDISLAMLELGWDPKVPLDTVLERKVALASEAWTG
jgi:nucleoside-diphosphate-sugar epimerase